MAIKPYGMRKAPEGIQIIIMEDLSSWWRCFDFLKTSRFLTEIIEFLIHLLHFCSTGKEIATHFPARPHILLQPGRTLFYWPTDRVLTRSGPCWKQSCCWKEIHEMSHLPTVQYSQPASYADGSKFGSLGISTHKFDLQEDKTWQNCAFIAAGLKQSSLRALDKTLSWLYHFWAKLRLEFYIRGEYLRLGCWVTFWAASTKLIFHLQNNCIHTVGLLNLDECQLHIHSTNFTMTIAF